MRGIWLTMLLVGCDATSPAAPTAPPEVEGPTGSASAPAPKPSRPEPSSIAAPPSTHPPWAGGWASTSCGARTYPRWVTLEADGRVVGQERISPCPPNVACVWSGVVPWKGRWTEADGTITLTVDDSPENPAMKPLPTSLRWDAPALVEPHESPCRYERRP